MSRYAEVVKRFRDAVLSGPAKLPAELRRRVFEGGDGPAETAAYLHKVRRHAYQVTDADVAALRASGWDDETIYELTVAAAVGQGLRRLDLGLAALRAAQQKAGK
jgi:alkylhydroperoxidase family enzyme